MSVIVWDKTGDHLYETGTKDGVLYLYDSSAKEFSSTASYKKGDVVIRTVGGSSTTYRAKDSVSPGEWSESSWEKCSRYSKGYAWNGLTGVTESPSGAEETSLYADDKKYLSLRSAEEFGATVEAYTYPDEFGICDGSAELYPGITIGQQMRKMFGLAFKTVVGNDESGNDYGYKIHLIYGATASPSERAYQTVNDSPEAITFSWEITTTPTEVVTSDGAVYKSTANVIIDSTKLVDEAAKAKLKTLEGMLFGTTTTDPYLPLPGEIYDLFNAAG